MCIFFEGDVKVWVVIVLCFLCLLAFSVIFLCCFFCQKKKIEVKKTIPHIETTVLPSFPVFDVDDMGNTTLHIAAKWNHHMIAIFCLNKVSAEAGTSSWEEFNQFMNSQNYHWETPLYIAVKNNSKDVFDILIRNRATDLNIPDQLGRTPLHIAIDGEKTYFIKKLIEKNANLDVSDRMGRTPRKMLKMRDDIGQHRL